MKIPIPKFYDQFMDALAAILFPSRKHIGIMLVVYTMLMAGVLAWYLDSWLWVPAVGASMLLAWYIVERL
jgi:hypothetical protein